METICSIKYCSTCQLVLCEWKQTSVIREHCIYDEHALEYSTDTETVDSYDYECLICHEVIDDLLISLESFQKVYAYCVNNKVKGMPFKYDCDYNNDIEISDTNFDLIMLESLL